jgi:hypothetical protein
MLTDAEIAGYMGWREPGAYTERAMRKVKAAMVEAVVRERESCAKICDERAEKCAVKLETTDDHDDRTELKANAWQFSVIAAEIRKRSNEAVEKANYRAK